ncbi:MAG: deoxyguanosinetriphosphate triphosphohydrolase [Oscillospiraceae bacterium]|nr:deoxyguanosinetriphosphate triphosphohydrolase [Oscillospiraceae bacterium]
MSEKITPTAARAKPEEPCPFRGDFQRDRDRIIHCNSFRRLKRKTQVFLMPTSEHYRTRLTHTLEVSQIARTIARLLERDEDLTEAIALGHDLGHSPFGHDGERALDAVLLAAVPNSGGFKHNEQSLRVVDFIEKDGEGLNLTAAVRDGILNHSSDGAPATVEGQIVRLSDKIAYINHDIEDAIRAGLLRESDLPKFAVEILGDNKTKRITALVKSIIDNSTAQKIQYDPETQKAHDELRTFMFREVYRKPQINAEKDKAKFIIEVLFDYYLKNTRKLPEIYRDFADKFGTERAAADFISGMTDDYAIRVFTELCVPKAF